MGSFCFCYLSLDHFSAIIALPAATLYGALLMKSPRFALILAFMGSLFGLFFSPAALAQDAGARGIVLAACAGANYATAVGQLRVITLGPDGTLCISAVSVSGTVTANQGTAGASPWPVKIDQTTPGSTNGVVANAGANVIGKVGTDPAAYKNVWIKPTIQNAAYAQGNALGGLMSFTVTSSGALMVVQGRSASGSTVAKTVRVWDHNPTNTTCTDKAAFVGSAADDLFMVLNGSLGQLFPAVSGDAATASFGALTNLALSYVSDGTTLYMCVTDNTAETPPTTGDWQFGVKTAQ